MPGSRDDYPEIGSRRGNYVLVCHGDDQPDCFASWLDTLVEKFRDLQSLAEERDIDIATSSDTEPIVDVMQFCEEVGVEFSSNFWEGSMVSGHYRFGWIEKGTVRAAKARGARLIKALEKHVEQVIRDSVLQEFQAIKCIHELVERATDDRDDLKHRIQEANAALTNSQQALERAQEELSTALKADSSAIDQACLRIAAALLTGNITRIVAGPIVLWEDGSIYAITRWGNTALPSDSSPAILLEALQTAGRPVVLVRERTVIGGWLSGPHYRHGPPEISGWADVWSVTEQRERGFEVDPPEFAQQVRTVHTTLARGR